MTFKKILLVAVILGLLTPVCACKHRAITLEEALLRGNLLEEELVIEVSPSGFISIGSALMTSENSTFISEKILRKKALRNAKHELIQFLFKPASGQEVQVEFVGGRVLREGVYGNNYRVAFYVDQAVLKDQ